MSALTAPDLLVPSLSGDTKIRAIKELVDRLHAGGVVRDSLSFLQAVLERENLLSTVLDHGVALPHARSRAVDRLGVAVGVSGQPIEYPSGDERGTVRVICLVAVPAQISVPYLELLAALSNAFGEAGFRSALLNATSPEELYHLLLSRPLV